MIVGDAVARSLSPDEIEHIEQRMLTRSERLAQKCHEFGLDMRRNDSLHRPNSWEFLVNRRFHLIWCNVFKAASTSWMYNFNILAGYSPQFLRKTNTVPLELARKRYERVSVPQVQFHALLLLFASLKFYFCFPFFSLLVFIIAGKSHERFDNISNCASSIRKVT